MVQHGQKNRFGSVWTGAMDRKRPVLGGSVRFPQYLGRSWTGCSPQLHILGAKNRTELNLQTLFSTDFHNAGKCPRLSTLIWHDMGGSSSWWVHIIFVALHNSFPLVRISQSWGWHQSKDVFSLGLKICMDKLSLPSLSSKNTVESIFCYRLFSYIYRLCRQTLTYS